MQAELKGLDERQVRLLLKVRSEALRDGTPASDLILLYGETAEDQAAVADKLAPGTGKDYLR